MKVRIDKSVFAAAKDANKQLELNFLLHIILYKHRYILKVTDAEILKSDSFKKIMQSEQTAIKEQIALSIVASNLDADCEVRIGGEREWRRQVFSPSEAIMFLMQPFSVILENGLNDAHFMEALFRLFDASGELIRHVNEGWIRFENAGGCSNVKNFLKARVGYYGGKEKFLRSFVLLDGDRRFPTDTAPQKKYKSLIEQLEKWDVSYHVLEKRCMENYMPDEAMDSMANKITREWILAYQMLSAEQKDFFCLAEGFVKDITKEQKRKVNDKLKAMRSKDLKRRKKSYVREFLPQDEQVFYHDVSQGNFLHLESGLKLKEFKIHFPEKYRETAFVYKSNMLVRTSYQTDPRELEHIVENILSVL